MTAQPKPIDDAYATELLREAVATPSLSGEEHNVAALLVRRMTELGFEARIDEAGNAVGARGAAPDSTTYRGHIILLGHTDTVSGEIPVRIEGDTLHGRGSVDAKGPLAAFIIGAAAAKLPEGVRITVVGAVEEEAATSKGARHIAEQFRGENILACFIGEPSGWDGVTLGYKGRLLLDYALKRPCSHSAGPDESAAEACANWWQSIRERAATFNEGRTRLFDQLLPSLRHINSTSDGLHETAEATVGLRLPPKFDTSEFIAFAQASASDAVVTARGHEPAHESRRTDPAARALVAAVRAEGGTPTLKLKTGTADMNVVAPIWQCPIAAYGPGDSRLDHTPEERISIAEYLRACRVVQRALESF